MHHQRDLYSLAVRHKNRVDHRERFSQRKPTLCFLKWHRDYIARMLCTLVTRRRRVFATKRSYRLLSSEFCRYGDTS